MLPPTPSLSGTAYDDFNIDVGGRTPQGNCQRVQAPASIRRSYGIAKGSVLNFQAGLETVTGITAALVPLRKFVVNLRAARVGRSWLDNAPQSLVPIQLATNPGGGQKDREVRITQGCVVLAAICLLFGVGSG